jgi:beta-glucosidase
VDPRLPGPEQALAGFAKVDLAPGEEREVGLTLEARAFSFYDPALHAWALGRGRFEIRVGSSSRDVRARAAVTLD